MHLKEGRERGKEREKEEREGREGGKERRREGGREELPFKRLYIR